MKKTILNILFFIVSFIGTAQVGIGTSSPQSILEIVSSNNALILPRVANTAAVTTPVNGMLIYDNSTECVKVYQSNSWSDCLEKNDSPPTASSISINGIGEVGQVLTGSYVYADIDADTEGTSTFRWYRADDAIGTNQTIIPGAISNTYTLTLTDLTKYVAFEVTPVASSGLDPIGASTLSLYQGPIIEEDSPPTASSLNISGPLVIEQVIAGNYTYTDVNADIEGASTFQWYRADDATGTNQTTISGATNNTYTLTLTDQTKYIAFEVTPIASTGTNPTGTPTTSVYQGPISTFKDETTVVQDVILPISGQTWMDRNLGATDAATVSASTEETSYGDLYQWGRGKDGHEDRNSMTSSVQVTGSFANNGGLFILNDDNWTSFTGNNLWEDDINNPCPTGYRVPTRAEWDAIRSTGTNEYGALNLPLSGKRFPTTGSISLNGFRGNYWISNSSISVTQLTSVNSLNTGFFDDKSSGVSVRCIKE